MFEGKRTRIVWACCSASVLAAGWGLEACSGDSNNADGGPDVTQGDSPASDGNPQNEAGNDSGSCPSYTGSTVLCQAGITHCGACGSNLTACQTAHYATSCEALANVYSTQLAAAYAACASTCDQDAMTACENANLADAALSSAQTKVATDYCGKCGGQDAGGCTATLEKDLKLVELNDSLAAQIDMVCSPDASTMAACSVAKYAACLGGQYGAALPADPCADASTD
jgi:hypothetical protein